jgi:hypothetical protein
MGNLEMLTTVVGRFTKTAQLTSFVAFLEKEKTNLAELHTSLLSAVATAQANIDWDEEYMAAFIKRLHEINSASTRIFSVVLSVVTLIGLYIFN